MRFLKKIKRESFVKKSNEGRASELESLLKGCVREAEKVESIIENSSLHSESSSKDSSETSSISDENRHIFNAAFLESNSL
jgi:hypothetical protein